MEAVPVALAWPPTVVPVEALSVSDDSVILSLTVSL